MRADSWILHDLPEFLIQDWYEGRIRTEHDMQARVCHWLHDYFDSTRSEHWKVLAQPALTLAGGRTVKPDIVTFKGQTPRDVFELKCQLHGLNAAGLQPDFNKLRELKTACSIRHAYQVVLYDDNDVFALRKRPDDDWAKRYISFIGANVRRHPSNRLRRGYDQARARWERFRH